MRVLCLHGKGTSGTIFKSQTSSFRAHLSDEDLEFDWVDGPYPTGPAAGVDLFYGPPYFSLSDGTSLEAIRSSYTWLSEYIAKNGPYDAALMFSQGCWLGSSALLLHQEETPDLPPPFKAAIFICGGPSLTVLEELGFHVSAKALERDDASRLALDSQADSSAIQRHGVGRWTGLSSLSAGVSVEELQKEITCPFRISVPTVHVYGSKDPRYASGVHLSGICDPEKRRDFDHGGGHEIPRTDFVSRTIAESIRWAIAQGTAEK
ncbi:hypothetical protein N7510_000762 [Penicillium lagena]|uniref:uncharacterized protein n=1 Tax=Penicillium lagena TaxID=94218 RepID=UPI00254077C3|nr:uncharacterized protein N7510_000762 [Penicillium lagena]KAJ5624453.1 hypothetical protein N7510_000762 [Penicillium lagena]